ncbi:hypothetical protein A2363_00360 [Candidatus Gottesmanbacteria bacterium RIFOXYB1_FULL_47_11]|uniref:M23ase beta-sheet core domain-containing protein n=1 Tax=Candidatus Gottesmanbacteria bacterium RIFOXYB1_FULL_47_11 TaxID=1798401 RepID=A0A1F6BED0_9BACT|nr:MAG: hypothetical protein A2363_00360 [Candidatus Gottesmanbacteria bacterium RIFOXYB1_FULL_47_11]
MAVASHESIVKALALWTAAQQGKTEEQWGGFVSKHNIHDPLDPYPPEQEVIDAFIKRFTEEIFPPKEGEPAPGTTIDSKKLEELVSEFDGEYEKTKKLNIDAQERAKQHIQEIIRHTVETPGVAPEQKELLFRVLKSQSEQHPEKTIPEIMPRAVEICENAQPFLEPDAFKYAEGINLQFADLKGLTATQKAVAAPFFDTVTTVFPELRQGAINKNLEDGFRKLLNVPGNILRVPGKPPGNMLVDLFGQKVVDSPLFKQMIADAKRSMPTQGAPRSSAVNILGDLTSSLFRKAPGEAFVAYWEVYQIRVSKGLPPPTLYMFQMRAASTGLGSQAFHLGVNFASQKAKDVLVQKGLAALLGKGATVAAEAAVPGVGWTVAAFELAKGLFGKATNWLKRLGGTKSGEVPGDKWILGIGCGAILLVFFILPVVTQLNFDSALVGRLALGGGQGTGPVVNCTQTPNDPLCTFTPCEGNCLWPASGYITQGPFTGGYCSNAAETSHDVGSAANGIDIATFDGGPVYTPRAGTVVDVYTGCADNSGFSGDRCGGSSSYAGYGNYVILKTDDGYTLIFAHLLSAVGVTNGQHVEAGAQLGWMDQTGSSTGTHLHFGVLSGGSVLDFVPKNDSSHTPESINGCMKGGVSCTKQCPTTPVTAGTP